LWPNGFIDVGETWDDDNFYNGDGWSDTCAVEVGWEWDGTPSVWRMVQTHQNTNQKMTNEALITQVLTSAAAVASIVSGFSSLSNPIGFWQMMNTMQLFMLILLLDIYLPIKILNIFKATSYFSLSFDVPFIPEIPFLCDVYDYLDFLPPKANYIIMGVDSGSTLLNFNSLLCILLCVVALHFLITSWKVGWRQKNQFKKTSIIKLVAYKIWTYFTFSIYIRLLLQTYQHLFLVSVSGLHYAWFKDFPHFLSSATSLLTWSIWVIILLFFIRIWWTNDLTKTNELFVGLKAHSISRTHQIVLILRKIVMISWMVLFRLTPLDLFLIIPFVYQFLHLWYVIVTRPFLFVKDNLVEIFNETVFTIMLSGLIYLKAEDKWEKVFTEIYVYLFMAPGIFMILVSLGKFSLNLCDISYSWNWSKSG
jgi:cysteine-rich repeat protein